MKFIFYLFISATLCCKCNLKNRGAKVNMPAVQTNRIQLSDSLEFKDGTKVKMGLPDNKDKIDSITFYYKDFEATIESWCYKGDSFFLDEKYYKYLKDKQIKRLVALSYIQDNTSPTCFDFYQKDFKTGLNLLNKDDVKNYCNKKSKSKVSVQAIVFKIYTENKIYYQVMAEKILAE